jgi:hypothetical protein
MNLCPFVDDAGLHHIDEEADERDRRVVHRRIDAADQVRPHVTLLLWCSGRYVEIDRAGKTSWVGEANFRGMVVGPASAEGCN